MQARSFFKPVAQPAADGFEADLERVGQRLDREAVFVVQQEGGALLVRQLVQAGQQAAAGGAPEREFLGRGMRGVVAAPRRRAAGRG